MAAEGNKSMEDEVVVWGEVSKEAYCTLHNKYVSDCAACNWAREVMYRTADSADEGRK